GGRAGPGPAGAGPAAAVVLARGPRHRRPRGPAPAPAERPGRRPRALHGGPPPRVGVRRVAGPGAAVGRGLPPPGAVAAALGRGGAARPDRARRPDRCPHRPRGTATAAADPRGHRPL